MKKKLKTLLIGFGNVAEKIGNDKMMKKFIKFQSHAQVLKAHPNFMWDAVIDSNRKRREVAEKKWKIPFVVDCPSKLPKEYNPDVVVLTTPPDRRINFLKKINDKKAVLVEKPLGLSLASCNEFKRICDKKKLIVQVNYFRRFDSTIKSLFKKKKQKIGNLQAGFCVYGNGLKNNAIHMIDLVRFLFGKIKYITAISEVSCGTTTIKKDKNLIFNLEFSNGSIINFVPINFNFYRDVYLDIWGTKGRIEIFQEGLFIRHSNIKKHRAIADTKEISIDRPSIEKTECGISYYNLYDNLYKSIKKNITPFSDVYNATKNEIIVDLIFKSLNSNSKKIKVDI